MAQENREKVFFHFLVPPFYFPRRKELKGFLEGLFKEEGKSIDTINYIFCTDAYLLELNKFHLKHNTYTDIITFELSSTNEPVLSDIYISVERIRENAQLFQAGLQKELHRVILHGALHLCGYKDKTKEQALKMRSMEDHYLKKYFVPRGT